MLAEILKYLYEHHSMSWLRVSQYITFRALIAAATSMLFCLYIGPRMIAYLKTKVIEPIKEEAPAEHKKKTNVPTMGGLLIISSTLISVLLWGNLKSPYMWLVILSMLWMGVIGFIDDYRKVILKIKTGLAERYKIAGQVSLGVIVGLYTIFDPTLGKLLEHTTVPIFKNITVDYGYWYVGVCVFIITAVSNAVNLTDGLDGLAAGTSAVSLFTLAIFAYLTGNIVFSNYLNITYLPDAGEITVIAITLAASCIGFLWFNAHPAQVFMGDTGSLAIGGAIATMALLIKKELLLPSIAGIFFIETVSVIIQRYYFKYTRVRFGEGKRVFLRAPLHHHYQELGLSETKIVIRFWIVAIVMALISLISLKLR